MATTLTDPTTTYTNSRDVKHQAATESRRVARELRHAGLSVADSAAVMDISAGRAQADPGVARIYLPAS